MSTYKYVKKLEELTINDMELVGGKNASLGEMLQILSKKGIQVPSEFAVTVEYNGPRNSSHLLS